MVYRRLGNTVNCLFCPWASISRLSRAPWFLLLIAQQMWGMEQVLQKGREYLCTIETNCGINSQSFHNGLHSLRFVMCNGRFAPIFTCHCSQSNKEEGWKFLFMCSKATGCWEFFFFLNRNNNSSYWEQMLTFGGCSSGWEKGREREREAGPLCALESASGAIWQQCWVLGGSPPENKACISINQLLMRVFGLKKKTLARGYDFHIGGCQWSKGK